MDLIVNYKHVCSARIMYRFLLQLTPPQDSLLHPIGSEDYPSPTGLKLRASATMEHMKSAVYINNDLNFSLSSNAKNAITDVTKS